MHVVLDAPNKSANVFTSELLADLDRAITAWSEAPPEIGLVISSAKPSIYIAGADLIAIANTLDWSQEQIRAFCRNGQSLFDRMTKLPCPSVAAIHGACLGGGLEFALACDARVASDDRKTVVGLPEVSLGLIPGWAGTVRTPRLIGLDPALDLVTSGRVLSAAEARSIGLVDLVAPRDLLLGEAMRLVSKLRAEGGYLERRQARCRAMPPFDDFGQLRTRFAAAIAGRSGLHPLAPTVALEVMLDSAADDFATACEKEGAAMARVYGSESNAGLLNTFFLNEKSRRLGKFSAATRPIQRVGIVGAGVMGGDIAFVSAGQTPISVFDLDPDRGQSVVQQCNLASGDGRAAAAANLADLAACDLVIESIVEDPTAKQAILVEIESRATPEAILATNTSVIGIDTLAERLARPGQFCGLHFCYPARSRRLVEVVRGARTGEETLANACAWVRSIGKIPLPVADAPGFIINRLLCPMFNEAGHLLTQGCPLTSVDGAMRAFGFALGPLEFMDAIGLDTLHAAGSHLIPRLATPIEPSLLLHAMNKASWRGRKSGRGFYAYPDPAGPPQANEQLAGLIEQYLRDSARPLSDDEIVRRLLMAMVNQAADALAEKVVANGDEIDIALIHGAGFPEHRGGLLFWARRQGLARLTRDLQSWSAAPHSARRYRVSKALAALAAS
jgi:3-hydroxyacyl-CoA dehydrogenase/enoyl-CoA hydratase/carnithine racemase